jgi:hypothetical protein
MMAEAPSWLVSCGCFTSDKMPCSKLQGSSFSLRKPSFFHPYYETERIYLDQIRASLRFINKWWESLTPILAKNSIEFEEYKSPEEGSTLVMTGSH